MDEKTAAKVEAQKEKFNARRDPAVECYLLKRGEHSKEFTATEIDRDFFSSWDRYREQTQFSFATTDEDFRDEFAKATHIAYGVGTLEVFVIEDAQKDKIYPDGTSPFYKAFAVRDYKERYTTAAGNYFAIAGNHLTIGGNTLGI